MDRRREKGISSKVKRNTSEWKGGTEKVKGYKGQDKRGVGRGRKGKRRVKKR